MNPARGGDELVGVAHANDRVEAEMIQGLLESAGITSALQHVGVDGPSVGIGWLNPSGGSRRVMVRANELEKARALLAEMLVEDGGESWTDIANASNEEGPGGPGGPDPQGYGLFGAYARIWAWSIGAMALAFAVFLLLRLL